jgi:hypothetical protein
MSHEQIIIRSRDFDPSKLEFGDVKTMKDTGAQFVSVQYEGKSLYIQTPEMKVPFGMNQYVAKGKDGKEGEPAESSAGGSWSLDLSFQGEDQNEDLRIFHEKLDKVEDVLTDVAFERGWVKDKKEKDPKKRNKSVSKEVLTKLINQQVKFATGEKAVDEKGHPKYPPTMRIKVPFDGKRFHQTEAYDESRELIEGPLNEAISKGCRVKCLIQCSAVYLGQSITLSWRLTQVKIRRVAKLAGYSFVDDGDEPDNSNDGNNNTPSQPKKPSKPAMIQDSDDDDDDKDGKDDKDDNDDAGSGSGSGSESDDDVVIPPPKGKGKNK